MAKTHIGNILHEVLKKQSKPINAITLEAGFKKRAMQVHKNKARLGFMIVFRYAKAIGYDFAKEIPQFRRFMKEYDLKFEDEPKTMEQLQIISDQWRERANTQRVVYDDIEKEIDRLKRLVYLKEKKYL